jgi:hypothetical protein
MTSTHFSALPKGSNANTPTTTRRFAPRILRLVLESTVLRTECLFSLYLATSKRCPQQPHYSSSMSEMGDGSGE